MASERTFEGVSEDVWRRLKATSREEFGTVYDPPDANQGVATTRSPIGEVVITFDYRPETRSLSYRIEKKPSFLPASVIFGGTQQRIDALSA